MPKLSVITCVFNTEKYIKESLDSVFSQTYTDFELILINDGSNDGTKDILLQYTDKPNVIYLENKHNEGIPFSRNKALLSALGEYVAIHDADDISLPHRFKKQVETLDSCPQITFIGSHAIRISDTGQTIGSMVYPPIDTEKAFSVIQKFKLNPIIDPSSMFRRQPIIDIGAYRLNPELRTVQDFDLWCRLLINRHLMMNITEPMIKYRINPNGVTRLKRQEQIEATDLVWSAFKKRSFPNVVLHPEQYKQESGLDILNFN